MWRQWYRAMCMAGVLALASGAAADIKEDPDLVIYFSFDDFGMVVPDESGNGHDGIVHGDVTPESDQGHRAARFKGTGGPAGFSYIDLDGANFPEPDIPKTGMTLAAWCKFEDTGSHHAIFNARAADGTWLVHPEARSNSEFRWLLRAAGGSTLFDIRAGTVTWGEWLHFAGMYDQASGEALLYINGEQVGQQNVADPREIAGDWGSGARLGFNIDNARAYTGLMDAFYLFKRALSEEEVDEAAEIPPQLKAYAPDPPDGETYVLQPLLRWQGGDTAALHHVYLGTQADLGPDDLAGPPTNMTMHWYAAGLEPGTTYHWRVDEVEADGVTIHTGDVWSFRAAPLTASDPNPWDGARWVDVDADLTWNPGVGAATHDVYFGTDRAAVAAADAGTFMGTHAATVYEPDTMVENTTYYWRIDTYDTANALHEGEVWTFATVAPGAGVQAQYFRGSELAGDPILEQIEPRIDHDWRGGEVAGGLSDDVSARWTANLEAPFTEQVQLITTHEDGVRLWLDGRLIIDNWKDYRATDDIAKVDMVAGQIYLLEMEWFEGGGNAVAKLSWQSPSIPRQIIPTGWLQLPVKATSPQPPNTAVGVTQRPVLRWSAGPTAAQHDVYFGTDAEAVAAATPADAAVYQGRHALDATTFDPGPLEWGKAYYWRIDEIEADGATIRTGIVWSFTAADFVVIDDFESYNNEIGSRPFEVWIDGFGFSQPPPGHPGNESNAAVGHDIWSPESPYYNGPLMESEMVHGGFQSMPVDYNNVTAPHYSEIERTWLAAQDWTVNGVNTLTLHVRGRLANDPERLYVMLQDGAGNSAVVTSADTTMTTSFEWVRWDISLTEFAGVDPAAIVKMIVGAGDRDAPAPGGAGTLFFDDFRVTMSAAE